MTEGLRVLIRTPHGVVLDAQARSARVPAHTGQVGLRPRQEPLLCTVEPGLVLVRLDEGLRYAATAGGLLQGDRLSADLWTPFAVVGERPAEVLGALDRALATPDSELLARRRLGELEQRILHEVRRPLKAGPERRHG